MTPRLGALVLSALLLSSAAAVEALECETLPDGEAFASAGSIVLLGELHGTAEAPAAVHRLACAALRRFLPVAVALEIPVAEQPLLDAYLSGETSIEGLLGGPFWQRAYQDGRSSAAMADLLARLRGLHREAASLWVAAIDEPTSPSGRDHAMAQRIAELADATADGVVVALTGNLHNRLTPGTRWNPEHAPMGFLLRRLRPRATIHAVDLSHEGGTAWICTGGSAADCGERQLKGGAPRDKRLYPRPPRTDDPFTAELHLGPITASRPAKDRH